jgi:hypothetical protein
MNITTPYCRVLIEFEELNHKSCSFVLWFEELKQEVEASGDSVGDSPLKFSETSAKLQKIFDNYKCFCQNGKNLFINSKYSCCNTLFNSSRRVICFLKEFLSINFHCDVTNNGNLFICKFYL